MINRFLCMNSTAYTGRSGWFPYISDGEHVLLNNVSVSRWCLQLKTKRKPSIEKLNHVIFKTKLCQNSRIKTVVNVGVFWTLFHLVATDFSHFIIFLMRLGRHIMKQFSFFRICFKMIASNNIEMICFSFSVTATETNFNALQHQRNYKTKTVFQTYWNCKWTNRITK